MPRGPARHPLSGGVMAASLHTHSWHSLLEGASSPEALLVRAASCGYHTLALTDTNNLYGSVAFAALAHHHGIRPILGACLRQRRARCVALIAQRTGFRNLCRVITRLHLGGSEELRARTEELGVKSSIPRSSLLTPHSSLLTSHSLALAALLNENAAGLHVLVDDVAMAERLREAFGRRLWLEVVRPAGQAAQEQELLKASRRLGLRPVASTAVHFATPKEYPVFRLLLAVQRGGLLDQLPARLPITAAHHLVDPDELRRRFADLPDAVDNTDRLAEQLSADVLPHEIVLPPARVPRQLEAAAFLRRLCERGLQRRGLAGDAAVQRLREELLLIEARDLADYFLVVRDIARYARHRGHGMALRGSAGNSLVCYLLEITEVNPLRFHLGLERFLHAGRPDLPDIDLDFDWKVRDEVLAHVFDRYGPAHTAMVSSHLSLQPRSAFREAAKAHGLSDEQISQLGVSREEWAVGGKETPASDAGAGSCAPPPTFPLEPQRWPRLLRDARRLLGRPHHLSIHPGGIVITPRPLEEYVPLQPAAKGVIITQFDKDAIEEVGLVKIDLLGNHGLATVDEAQRWVAAAKSKTQNATGKADRVLCTSHPGFAEPLVADLLRRGDTLGVTQLESPAMRHLLVQLGADSIDDVIQALAAIRPGPAGEGMKGRFLRRRRGLEPVPRLHPRLDQLLAESEGLILYDDDGPRVIQALTGLALPESYAFFRRITRLDNEEEGKALAEEFLKACAAQGVAPELAEAQWQQLRKFRRYAFCKSHAVSYGLLAWKGAWLKARYPLCFWTAVLNNNQGLYPRRVYVEAAKRAGFVLRLPCVNYSAAEFQPERGRIRVGLDTIATLPEEVRARLLRERQRHGPYRDLADLRRRVAPGPEALAALIRCGALDFTGVSRPALFLEADLQDRREQGQAAGPLFSWLAEMTVSPGWAPADYPQMQRWRDEWALLGFLVGPPLMALFRPRLPADLVTSRDLARLVGRRVRLAGILATARQAQTTDGRQMMFVTLEDEGGLIEVNLFPETCAPPGVLELGPYLVEGVVENHLGVHGITAHSFRKWEPAESPP
jgi:DNA-directed DNA polymerase III PolC